MEHRLAIRRRRLVLQVQRDLANHVVELGAIERRLPQESRRVVVEPAGVEDLLLAIFGESAGIGEGRVQLILHGDPQVRLAARGLAALDDPLDPLGHAELRMQPDGVAPPPGGLIGTRTVPVVRLLLADELDAGDARGRVEADDLPTARRPIAVVDLPRAALGESGARCFDEAARFEQRRTVERRQQGARGGAVSLPWPSTWPISRRTELGLTVLVSCCGWREVRAVMKATSQRRGPVSSTKTSVSRRYCRWNCTFGISVSSVYEPP